MLRTRRRTAGTRALLVGLVVAAIASGTAAAAVSTLGLRVHARLAPKGATTAAGRFSGTIVKSGDGGAAPRAPIHWQLTWSLRLPALHGSKSASLRIGAGLHAPAVARALCTGCTTTASGTLTLTPSQVFRIAQSHGTVVVRAPSATLRGAVKVLSDITVLPPT